MMYISIAVLAVVVNKVIIIIIIIIIAAALIFVHILLCLGIQDFRLAFYFRQTQHKLLANAHEKEQINLDIRNY